MSGPSINRFVHNLGRVGVNVILMEKIKKLLTGVDVAVQPCQLDRRISTLFLFQTELENEKIQQN